jgi:hypothetical protein
MSDAFRFGPSFGSTIRGARLGYRWSDDHEGFVRMSEDHASGRFRIDLAPEGLIPAHRTASGQHAAWWEHHEILAALTALRGLKIRRVESFLVDDDGCRV